MALPYFDLTINVIVYVGSTTLKGGYSVDNIITLRELVYCIIIGFTSISEDDSMKEVQIKFCYLDFLVCLNPWKAIHVQRGSPKVLNKC